MKWFRQNNKMLVIITKIALRVGQGAGGCKATAILIAFNQNSKVMR